MAGTIKTNAVQLGDSATDSQNFQLRTNVDGTAKLARGAAGNLGDVLTVDASSNVAVPQNLTVAGKISQTTAQSMVRLNTANGYGSTNTVIRRFTNTTTNQGADITYADSATLGATFTINTNGVYAISYTDNFTASSAVGLSLNSTALTTAPQVLAVAEILAIAFTISNGLTAVAAWTGYLPSGSIVRAQTQGTAVGTSVNAVQFTITRVA